MNRELNIVSFDVPFLADYGGVIDVYHKLTALKKAGVNVHLHCFEYGRGEQKALNKVCTSVHYYKRKNSWEGNFSLLPYIVYSRTSEELTKNLLKNNFPILFEGLHSCYLLSDERFASRKKIYRESNIEHKYYFNLSKSEQNVGKKIFFLIESLRLKMFEKKIQNASLALAVSKSDTDYFSKKFPNLHTDYLPSFHPNDEVVFTENKEEYILFHGHLAVPENDEAAEFIIEKVIKGSDLKLIVAGKNPSKRLTKIISENQNVELIANPDEEKMQELIRKAQINFLYTSQPAGLKLKLLNVLFNGGFCLANPAMLDGTGLECACEIASSPEIFKLKIKELMLRKFSMHEKAEREKLLFPLYSNKENAEKLIKLVFE